MTERLQKLLASAGHGSRRGIEEWIRAGRVTINDRVATLGDRASNTDRICLDGRPLDLGGQRQEIEVLMYHKPVGEVTTRSDPEGRPTVFDNLPAPTSGRWVVVGRLDVNTSGLLLFTNDGELAHRLMHPKFESRRVYCARVQGKPTSEPLAQLDAGIIGGLDGSRGSARSQRVHRVTVRELRLIQSWSDAIGFHHGALIVSRFGGRE